MPWSMDNLPDSAKKLSDEQKKKFISIANSMLKQGKPEGEAIATGLKQCRNMEETIDECSSKKKSFNESTNDFFEGDWVEVFKAGKQTDSAGNERTWTEGDIKDIANKYNQQEKHEAPLVVGHPKDNAPAFGWVESLKANGKTLLAKFKQVMPEFVDAVKEGRYKKRSISLYNDLTLRHIGFLGAVPPAVKGLADIAFSEDDEITYEYSQDELESGKFNDSNNEKGEKTMTKELEEKLAKAEADNKSFSDEIAELKEASKKQAEKLAEYEEAEKKAKETADHAEAEKKAKEEADKKEKKSEFEEATDKRIAAMEAELAVAKKQNRVSEYKEFVKDLHSQGKVVTECQDTLIDLMEALHDKGEMEFAEDGEVKKGDILSKFKEYLDKQPVIVDMKEVDTKGAKKKGEKSANDQLVELAEKLVKDEKMSYSAALAQVQKENPELAEQAFSEV